MSVRSAPDRNTDSGRRSRRGGETGEAGHAAPLNLGCGTLVVLFLLVATAGKFLPHRSPEGSPATPSAATPSVVKGGKPAVRDAATPPTRASKVTEKPVVTAPKTAPKAAETASPAVKRPGTLDDLAGRIQTLASTVVGSLAGLVPGPEQGLPASRTPSPAESGVAAARPSAGQGGAAARVGATPPVEKAAAAASRRSQLPPAPESPPVVRSKTPAAPIPGKAVVFNSPWDRSVEQVLRYLKRHTHDAESIEVLEWGTVKPTDQGYEVRCAYRSRNVLGRLATQNQLFVLDKDGQVTDIRD